MVEDGSRTLVLVSRHPKLLLMAAILVSCLEKGVADDSIRSRIEKIVSKETAG